MDPIFDRFGRLVKSWFAEEDDLDDVNISGDSDYRDAWEELEGFLNSDGFEKEGASSGGYDSPPEQTVPEHLRKDYDLLGVPFNSPLMIVKKAYKKLILEYHPDRFASDPHAQKNATKKAAAINDSFRRIEEYFEASA